MAIFDLANDRNRAQIRGVESAQARCFARAADNGGAPLPAMSGVFSELLDLKSGGCDQG
jgi:hypothetical protein